MTEIFLYEELIVYTTRSLAAELKETGENLMTLRPRNLTPQKLRQLVSVSRREASATVWIRGAEVLNVYTSEIRPAHVVVFEDRIAYVGDMEPMTNEKTEVIDANGYVLVPGYIEPHAHSFQIYNPVTLAEYALARGTTVLLHDNLPFFLNIGQENLNELLASLWKLPVKNYWWGRVDPQVKSTQMDTKFQLQRIKEMMDNPLVLQAGELTDWKDMLDGNDELLLRLFVAQEAGKRVETHNPGASVETLNALAAAGATACHESVSAEDVLRRIRLGYHAAIRHSSIRPDLERIVSDLLDLGNSCWDRLMFTTDGSPPFFLAEGIIDECIRIAIRAGLEPTIAYRMASLNPAVYYGLDREVGGIAPGRIADILFLKDLRDPTPSRVMADGRVVAEQGRLVIDFPDIDWGGLEIHCSSMMPHVVKADWFRRLPPVDRVPVIEYRNAVITTVKYVQRINDTDIGMEDPDATSGIMRASLLDRGGKWITNGFVRGLGKFDALAASYSLSGDLVVIGQDTERMAQAVTSVLDMRGGICFIPSDGSCFQMQLPLLGLMSSRPMTELIADTRRFVELMREAGYKFSDPIYSLLFLTATHLPSVRLTDHGVIDVKTGDVLLGSLKLD
jgi:adenine deaminase